MTTAAKLDDVSAEMAYSLRERGLEGRNHNGYQEHHLNVEAITRADSNAPDDVKELYQIAKSVGYNNDSFTILLERFTNNGGYGIHGSHYWYNQYNYDILENSAKRLKNIIKSEVLDKDIADEPFQNLNSVFRTLYNE
ncbi:hypothetical protein [Flammeovirga agarivorans]|uniref:Uncharacterized protein n=1 Tax=Flammeovirga agarivorans TaxID=2726742 RepID=A0A7X8XW60_9BACT|nr:hypothetical protein [Flammeovirga agarivorans]NLR92013.1 hypothetical protein [Flammeovirga agarivorans]